MSKAVILGNEASDDKLNAVFLNVWFVIVTIKANNNI